MRSGAFSTTQRNIISGKKIWQVSRENGFLAILVVAIGLISSNTRWVEGLSILGGNQGPYGASLPSLDDLGQFVEHVEDEIIGHDASEVPDNLVGLN